MSWKKDFWNKLTLAFYTNYTVGQEKRTPWMQQLRSVLKCEYGDDIPKSFRERFRAASRPLMKYTNFAFELTVLNGILIYMMCRHEKICRRFVKELETSAPHDE